MTTFDDRERAFENMYARDQEMQFKIVARRNRLLGQWAAGLMGLSAPPACVCSCAERTTSGYIDDAEMIVLGTVVSIQSPRGGSSAQVRRGRRSASPDAGW